MQCDTKAALNAFHHQVFEEPTKIGVIGCGCSVSTEPVATISHYYNLVQVYYNSTGYTPASAIGIYNYMWMTLSF